MAARPPIFTREYIREHPDEAAAALNAAWYQLVELEAALVEERRAKMST